jgi:hypothetical protein
VALGGPNIYPGVLTWLGVARELTGGVPVLPVITHPLEQGSFEPEDTPKFLQDKSIRGAMTDLFYETLGVESATFSFGGPNFLDSHGYFFDNVFGDLSTVGSTPTNVATMSASTAPIGSTVITTTGAPAAGCTVGASIQLGTGSTAEVVIVSSTGATTIGFINNPLRFAHSANTVATVITPFTHKFAALNSQLGYGGAFGAQPPTHTFTDVTNIVTTFTNATYGTSPTNTFGARYYPFSCLKQIDFSGNAEQLLGIKMSGDSFLSQPWPAGSSPTNVTTNSRPIPNWNSTVSTIGPSGNQVQTDVGEFSVSFKRQTQVYWTVQGTQTPLVIARGPLNVDGTIQYDPTINEFPLDYMLLNAQAPMTITSSNTGIANSGTPFTLTFTMSQVANIKSKPMRSKALFGYSNSWEGIANATDVGGSGGLGPGTITLTNSTPTY